MKEEEQEEQEVEEVEEVEEVGDRGQNYEYIGLFEFQNRISPIETERDRHTHRQTHRKTGK